MVKYKEKLTLSLPQPLRVPIPVTGNENKAANGWYIS
jgi:hypothetical protein